MQDGADPLDSGHQILHATCVAVAGRGALIIGPSGSGKSSLALSLMAFGASLVADDRVILRRNGGLVVASAPQVIRGLIEARGVGLLTCDAAGPVPIAVVVDMEKTEMKRYPDRRWTALLGQPVTLLYHVPGGTFAPALLQYLKSGRHESS